MGALAGHILHLYENLDLTVYDLYTVFKQIINGWCPLYEKFDGYNVNILCHNDKIYFARNQHDLQTFGFTDKDIDNRFSTPAIREVFRHAYVKCVNELEQQILDPQSPLYLPDFAEERVTLNAEILNGKLNVISYQTDEVIVHSIFYWKENINHSLIVKDIVPVQSHQTSSVVVDAFLAYGEFERQIQDLCVDLISHNIGEPANMVYKYIEDATLRDLYKAIFYGILRGRNSFIQNPVLLKEFQKLSEGQVKALFNRFFDDGTQFNLRDIRNMNPKVNLDLILSWQRQMVNNTKRDIYELFVKLETILLQHCVSYRNEKRKTEECFYIKQQLNDAMLHTTCDNTYHLDALYETNFAINALEGIVFWYNGVQYKITGTFAPINQILRGKM